MTTNVNIKVFKGQSVYCGRGRGDKINPNNCAIGERGWLGNPVVIGRECPECGSFHNDGGSTLKCYEQYLIRRLKEPSFKEEFMKLEGKVLGCFCKPSPCHTDVIIRVLQQLK